MPTPSTSQRLCRFPGCDRPTEPADSGRPPEYCDNPEHNRATAWRARRRQGEAAAAPAPQDDRPIDAAHARASQLTAQVTGMAEHLADQLTQLLQELRSVRDPDLAQTQIAAVTADAAEQVAAANARASRAEQAHQLARTQADDATAAADEAIAHEEELTRNLADHAEELRQLRDDHAALVAEHAATTQALHDERQTAQERDRELQAAIRDLDTARDLATQHQRDRDHANQRAAAAETTNASLREQLDATRDQITQLRTHLATTTAERDAARTETERERQHADQRVQDLHATYRQQRDSSEG